MHLLELTISATLMFGGPGPMTATVDVYPVVGIQTGVIPCITACVGHDAMTLPHVVLYYEPSVRGLQEHFGIDLMAHELEHARQWEALGPSFLAVHLASGGRAFEDYANPDGWAWHPPEDMRNCPFLRFEASGPSLMPCWQVWRD